MPHNDPGPQSQAKRLAERKAAMQRYEQRSKEQEQKAKEGRGVKEPVEIQAPKDVLDLTVMNLLAEPALLDAHGSGEGVRTLTQQQAVIASASRWTHERLRTARL
jgi:hypothetical protein